MAEKLTLKDIAKKPDLLMSGHRLCAGCAAGTIVRLALKATRGPVILANATGCLEVATTIFPYSSWKVPWIHNAFENVAATASGIEAAFRAMKKVNKGPLAKYEHIDVIAFAGDGGTYDIGFQALSGALERGHDFLYILYDNEAYMNTGIQRSGGTPRFAWTTTSPAGKVIPGKRKWKKPIARVVAEHEIPYVATASIAYPMDFVRKVRKGLEVEGPAFIHVLSPCTRGWRYPPEKTIKIAKLAVETCFLPLWEAEFKDGEIVYTLSAPSERIARKPELKKPIEEYLKLQGRFSHLFRPKKRDDLISEIQQWVDYEWRLILKRCGKL